jgi:DNA repair exonuclease SbcCD nuclease subunit
MNRNFTHIIFWGDTHGDLTLIKNFINRLKIEDALIIQVGDFGIGFEWQDSDDLLKSYQSFLKSTNNHLWAIRGNHDDPKYFKGNHKFDNLWLVPDYTTATINDKGFLFIGGATSVDRKKRNGYITGCGGDYWFDESVVYDDKVKEMYNINVIVTHTCPDVYLPLTRGGYISKIEKEPLLKRDVIKEREILTQVYNDLKDNNYIEYWFMGHFHKYQKMMVDVTNFIQLDVQENYELNF